MGENTPIALQIDFIGTIVLGAQQVGRGVVQQSPGFACILLALALAVPFTRPLRIGVVIVTAGDEIATVGGIPECLANLARHRDGAAVLSRHSENLRAACVIGSESIGECCGKNRYRGASLRSRQFLRRIELLSLDGFLSAREQWVIRIFDVIGELTGLAIKPYIADHAMFRWKCARCQRRVPNDSLGVGILVMGIGIDGATFQQVFEAPLPKASCIPVEQVGAQPIHGYLQHKPDIRFGFCIGGV